MAASHALCMVFCDQLGAKAGPVGRVRRRERVLNEGTNGEVEIQVDERRT